VHLSKLTIFDAYILKILSFCAKFNSLFYTSHPASRYLPIFKFPQIVKLQCQTYKPLNIVFKSWGRIFTQSQCEYICQPKMSEKHPPHTFIHIQHIWSKNGITKLNTPYYMATFIYLLYQNYSIMTNEY